MEATEKVYRSRKTILLDNFLGGIVWSLGVWVGTTIILALVFYLISKIDLVPIIGDFIASITKYIAKDNRFLPF